jgi:hypothetical protein
VTFLAKLKMSDENDVMNGIDIVKQVWACEGNFSLPSTSEWCDDETNCLNLNR